MKVSRKMDALSLLAVVSLTIEPPRDGVLLSDSSEHGRQTSDDSQASKSTSKKDGTPSLTRAVRPQPCALTAVGAKAVHSLPRHHPYPACHVAGCACAEARACDAALAPRVHNVPGARMRE